LDSLINNHPFLDGNKPTGITAAGLFLFLNKWKLNTSPEDLETITLRVGSEGIKATVLAGWLRKNTVD
jgi:death-on-curing protein